MKKLIVESLIMWLVLSSTSSFKILNFEKPIPIGLHEGLIFLHIK